MSKWTEEQKQTDHDKRMEISALLVKEGTEKEVLIVGSVITEIGVTHSITGVGTHPFIVLDSCMGLLDHVMSEMKKRFPAETTIWLMKRAADLEKDMVAVNDHECDNCGDCKEDGPKEGECVH